MTKLSKKVCKICRKADALSRGINPDDTWNKNDEAYWAEGRTFCPFNFRVHSWSPLGVHLIPIHKIPDFCDCRLEHTVLSEKPK